MINTIKRSKKAPSVLLVLLLSIMTINNALADQSEELPTYCGGMLYQVGWSKVLTFQGEVSGISTGLGGKLAFYILPSFRVGAMGFSNNLRYDTSLHTPSSYISLGAGGITMEMVWNTETFRVVPGLMFGGGSFEYLNIISGEGDEKVVNYDKYSSFLFSPLLSVEVPLSNKISTVFMADWIFGNSVIAGNNYGPGLRLGVLFTH